MEGKRQKQVGEIIKRNFGIVLRDEGSYIFGSAFVTVTTVKVSPDLSIAKIYLSVLGVEDKQSVINKIQEHHHRLKQGLAYRIRNHVRRVPKISFFLDELIDEMYRVNDLMDSIDKKQSSEEE